MNENINYKNAFEELQNIVAEIENGQISIDELSHKVERAAELIHLCKTKLSTTEESVENILRSIQALDKN